MSLDPVVNFGKVTVAGGNDHTIISIILVSGDGAKLPNPAVDGSFNLVWWNSTDYGDPTDDPYREIVRCTARAVDVLTIVRAQEGTAGSDKNISGRTYQMINSITQKMINDIKALIVPPPTWIKDSIGNGTITGAIDGVNVQYIISEIPLLESGDLVINGQIYTEGIDYTVDASHKKITMSTPLPTQFATLPFVFKYQY